MSGPVGAEPASVPALSLREVRVRYPEREEEALAGCSLELGEGERVALLGGNGSGKTTLLAAAVGLVPHRGEIRVAGRRVEEEMLPEVREGVGFLFANPEDQLLFPRALDDVAFALESRGAGRAEARAAALSALSLLGVGHLAERSPYRMSSGERLRVALAGALAARPPLLLLDEPTSGLDPAGRRLLAAHLAALPSAMLVATHEIDFARLCCQRYVLLEAGRVVAEGADFGALSL